MIATLSLFLTFCMVLIGFVQAQGLRPPGPKDRAHFEALDKRYQGAKSISMDVEKKLILSAIGQERESKGTLILSKGQMRLETVPPEKSLVIINKETVWVVNDPPAEFKNAAVQIGKGKIDTQKGKSQGLLGLLLNGGFLKHFKLTGVQKQKDGQTRYFLQPEKQTVELKRAQVFIRDKDAKNISELRFWDELDNETQYKFKNIVFDKKLDAKIFEYTPPKGADVSNF